MANTADERMPDTPGTRERLEKLLHRKNEIAKSMRFLNPKAGIGAHLITWGGIGVGITTALTGGVSGIIPVALYAAGGAMGGYITSMAAGVIQDNRMNGVLKQLRPYAHLADNPEAVMEKPDPGKEHKAEKTKARVMGQIVPIAQRACKHLDLVDERINYIAQNALLNGIPGALPLSLAEAKQAAREALRTAWEFKFYAEHIGGPINRDPERIDSMLEPQYKNLLKLGTYANLFVGAREADITLASKVGDGKQIYDGKGEHQTFTAVCKETARGLEEGMAAFDRMDGTMAVALEDLYRSDQGDKMKEIMPGIFDDAVEKARGTLRSPPESVSAVARAVYARAKQKEHEQRQGRDTQAEAKATSQPDMLPGAGGREIRDNTRKADKGNYIG